MRDTLGLIYLHGNPEQCIYDFNLNIGDSLPSCYGNSDQIVSSIDSLLIAGTYRKVFHLSVNGAQSQEIIEGVGHEYGFIESLPPILECANILECYSMNDTSYYPSSGLFCQSTISVKEISGIDFSVFPTPANEFITISINNFAKPVIAHIYDNIGQLIKSTVLISARTDFSLRELNPGIYFIRFEKGMNQVLTFMLILNQL